MTETPVSRPTWCQGVPEPAVLETGWRRQQKFTQTADPDRMGVSWGDLGFLSGAPASEGRTVEREDLINEDGMLAFMLHNVLSEEECDQLVDGCNGKGFTPALVNIGRGIQQYIPDYRSGSRCIVDSVPLGSLLFNRVGPFLPAELPSGKDTLFGINERMRVLCYHEPQHRFEEHFDGCFRNPRDGSFSHFTLQVYLNTIPDPEVNGGGTAFTRSGKVAQPRKGSCLVFSQHNLEHQGQALLTGGLKYTMRTEAMYRRRC